MSQPQHLNLFIISGVFNLITTILCFHLIFQHLKNYKRPDLQRPMIRILWMPLLYSFFSWLSFGYPWLSFYLEPLRDCYEAFVLWVFFHLLVQLMGGERNLLITLDDGRLPTLHSFPFNFCLSPTDFSNYRNFVLLKRGILQFVVFKPIHALCIILFKSLSLYYEGSPIYIILVILYNMSILISMYCLILFYQTTKHDLKQHQPMLKFLCIKSILFFSFWQSLLIALLVHLQLLPEDDYASVQIQDFLICFEMIFASLSHHWAFSSAPFAALDSARLSLKYAIKDALGVKDLVIELQHTIRGTNFYAYNELLDPNAPSRQPLLQNSKRYLETNEKLGFDDLLEDEEENIYQQAKQLDLGDYGYKVVSK